MNIKCTNCGADMPQGTAFCGLCGTTVQAPAAAPQAPAPSPFTAPPPPPPPGVQPQPTYAASTAAPPPPGMAPMQAAPMAPPPPPASPFGPVQGPAPAAAIAAKPDKEGGAGGIVKIIIIIAVVAAIAIGGFLLITNVFSGGKYTTTSGSVQVLQGWDGSTPEVIIVPHGKSAEIFDGTLVSFDISMCGRKAAVLIREENDPELLLYYVTNKITLVTDEAAEFWFAPGGGAIAYTKYEAPRDSDSARTLATDLFLYNGRNERKVCEDLWIHSDVALSPDGKTLGYVVVEYRYNRDTWSFENERYTGVIWRNNKETEIGRDNTPLALANGAKYIYFARSTDTATTFNVQRGFNENRRERLGESVFSAFFNRDLSQVVFNASTNSGSRAFISIKGAERQQLTKTVSNFVLPAGTMNYHGVILGVSDFKNTFYVNGDAELLRITNKWDTVRIHSSVSSVRLASNGKTLTYMRNSESIFRVNGRSSADPDRIVDRDASSFHATSNGNAIFYINDDGDLIYLRGNRDVTVASERTSSRTMFKGTTLFYINSDDELFSSTGQRGTRVSGLDGDVIGVSANMHSVLVTTRDGSDTFYYLSTNGRTFRKIN